jgi:hypothetical protein
MLLAMSKDLNAAFEAERGNEGKGNNGLVPFNMPDDGVGVPLDVELTNAFAPAFALNPKAAFATALDIVKAPGVPDELFTELVDVRLGDERKAEFALEEVSGWCCSVENC